MLTGSVVLDRHASSVSSLPLVYEAPPASAKGEKKGEAAGGDAEAKEGGGAGEKAGKQTAAGGERGEDGGEGGEGETAEVEGDADGDAEAKAAAEDEEALAKAVLEAKMGRLGELIAPDCS